MAGRGNGYAGGAATPLHCARRSYATDEGYGESSGYRTPESRASLRHNYTGTQSQASGFRRYKPEDLATDEVPALTPDPEFEQFMERFYREQMGDEYRLRARPRDLQLDRDRLLEYPRGRKNSFRSVGLKTLQVSNFIQLVLLLFLIPVAILALMLGKLG